MSDKALMPLGKYKGQPVEVALADPSYCQWLIAQPWFRDQHPVIYQTIINYGGEPQDSPEHNQMQVAFLNEAVRRAVAEALVPAKPEDDWVRANPWVEDLATRVFPELFNVTHTPAYTTAPSFENGGWDVRFTSHSAAVTVKMLRPPPCTCGNCDHDECPSDSECRDTDQQEGDAKASDGSTDPDPTPWRPPRFNFNCRHRKCDWATGRNTRFPWRYHSDTHHDDCFYSDRHPRWTRTANDRTLVDTLNSLSHGWHLGTVDSIAVELKPDMGDDFPSVLRAMKRRPYPATHRCLIVRRAAFEHVTWEQVHEVFAAEGITLLREDGGD